MIHPVRILLVDDSPDFLASAAAFVCARSHLQLEGAVTSGTEALELAEFIQVDLVLLDLHMRGLNGFETTRRLKARPQAPKIIIVTLQDAPEYRHIAGVVGADGFITKSEFTTVLLPLIDTLFPVHLHR